MGSDLPPQQAWNLAAIANSLFCAYADFECPHGHIPSDRNITCDCWTLSVTAEQVLANKLEYAENRDRERHDELVAELKSLVSAVRAQTETIASLARDQRVTSRAVLDAANGTHR